MSWVDPMAVFISSNQRQNSKFVSATEAPAHALRTLYQVDDAAIDRVAKRVSYFI